MYKTTNQQHNKDTRFFQIDASLGLEHIVLPVFAALGVVAIAAMLRPELLRDIEEAFDLRCAFEHHRSTVSSISGT
jgi:hypothetical protein